MHLNCEWARLDSNCHCELLLGFHCMGSHWASTIGSRCMYCRAPAVLSGSNYAFGFPLYYRGLFVLSGSNCAFGLPLYYRGSSVLSGSNCAFELHCQAPIVLSGSHCITGLPLYYWAPIVLLGSHCTAAIDMHIRISTQPAWAVS